MKIRKGETSGNLCRRKNSHRGFTLVETIVAFVILGIILLALSLLPIMTTKMMSDTVEREKAVLLAVGKMDALEGDITAVPGTETQDGYTMSWTADTTSGNYVITLTISWPGVVKQETLTFKRQIANN
jgi:prepilin-type N-terminal cleavage/methylation domain-containing protein